MDCDIPGKHIQSKKKKKDLDLGHLAVKAILSFMFLHRALFEAVFDVEQYTLSRRGTAPHSVCAGASRGSELKSRVGIQMNAGIHGFQRTICSRSILFICFGF